MAPHTPRSILVIDDEPGIVHALTRLLQRDGYVVETAGNGRDGLAALQMKRYDVILCDLRMPELDGRAFYAHLQQQAPRLCQRVIFLTGDSSAADNQAFLTQYGRPWLDKPCPIAAIWRAIAQVLERVMLAQQLSRTCRELRQQSPCSQYSHLAYPANRSLQQYGRSNHRNDDDNGSDNQPVSPPRSCLRRPIVLLLRLTCRSLGGPSGLFFLLGFLRFSHGLPLCYGAVVVVALAV